MLSFIAAISMLMLYDFLSPYERNLIEKGVTLMLIAGFSFLFLLCCKKMVWRPIRRSWSRYWVRRAYKKLFKQTSEYGYGSYTAYRHHCLLRRLTRHFSEFVEDTEQPMLALVRRYAEGMRTQISKRD